MGIRITDETGLQHLVRRTAHAGRDVDGGEGRLLHLVEIVLWVAVQMAAHTADECRLLPLERETFRRVGYIRVRRHVSGAAQSAFVKWLREKVRAEDWSGKAR
jgi:hypothetical protein